MSTSSDNMPFDTSTHDELALMQGFPPPSDKRVDAQNGLWVAPYNRWAYQHMRRLLPSAPFSCADTPVVMPRRVDDSINQIAVRREDGSEARIETFLEETFTDSLVVVHDGSVVYERYLNGMTSDQPHQMMSCTKSFIGLFSLAAVEDGLASESDSVGSLVPEVNNGGAFVDASLGDVLNMTSSMSFNEDYDDPAADIHDYARIVGLGAEPGSGTAANNIYDYLQTLSTEPGLEHGHTFHYQSPKTDMVNWVTNRLTDISLLDNFEALWKALGTDGEAYLLLDPAGTPVAAGGLNATPADLARFATMIAGNGRFNDRQIIPETVIDAVAAGASTEAFLNGPDAAGLMADGHWSYRAQWWVRGTPGREAISGIGVNGQWIYCDRDRNVAIVKQSSQPVAVSTYFDDYTLNAFDAVIDAVTQSTDTRGN